MAAILDSLIEERKIFLPRGWLIGERKEGRLGGQRKLGQFQPQRSYKKGSYEKKNSVCAVLHESNNFLCICQKAHLFMIKNSR